MSFMASRNRSIKRCDMVLGTRCNSRTGEWCALCASCRYAAWFELPESRREEEKLLLQIKHHAPGWFCFILKIGFYAAFRFDATSVRQSLRVHSVDAVHAGRLLNGR